MQHPKKTIFTSKIQFTMKFCAPHISSNEHIYLCAEKELSLYTPCKEIEQDENNKKIMRNNWQNAKKIKHQFAKKFDCKNDRL